MNRQDDPQIASIKARFNPLLDRFAGRWDSGVAPEIRDFLAAEPLAAADQQRLVLAELVKIDLERRWRSDGAMETIAWENGASFPDRPVLEDYVAEYPELGPLDSLPLDLIGHEFDVRKRFGDKPSRDEYMRRFPDRKDEIEANLKEAEVETSVNSTVGSTVGVTDRSSTRPSAALKQFGDYELIEEIARGGMGVVFKARQLKLNRIVAMKMILSGDLAGEEEVWRFKAEAEAAANLDHPGIVPIYEIGEHNGQHFFSMGFVEGKSLAARVKEEPLAPSDAARMVRKVTAAVAYAHEKGVIHRDLKPANVLLDAKEEPRVTDFGLAKQVQSDRDLTRTGAVMGTPNYMPPEQAAGQTQDIGVQADVYSLGAILYELLAGRPPFRGATPLETLRQVLEDEPVDPSRLNPAVNRDLETICLKCLAKEPERRYQTAAELGEELDRYLDGRPIQARRLGTLARGYRWCRRRPMQAGFAATVVLFLLALGTFFVVNRQASHALQVTKLKSNFNAQLDEVEPTPASIAGLEGLIDTLRYLSPAEAEVAETQLTRGVASAIEVQLQQSSITGEESAIREAMAWVRSRDASLGEQLEANWRARLSDWRERAAIEPATPPSEAVALFPGQELQEVDGALQRLGTESDRVLLQGDCPTTTEIEVQFAEGWRDAARVGLLLNADQERGYEFVVSAPSDGKSASPRLLGELTATEEVNVEIRKSGGVLQRQVLTAGQLGEDRLTLRARRERSALSFQVGVQAPIQVQDVFAASSARGSIGLIWPASARVASLQARYRELPSEPRAIEQADQYLEQNQFLEALEIYQQLARKSTAPADQAELNYKSALCLLKLKRTAEGIRLLEETRRSQEAPWDLLASSQRWLMHLKNKELVEANAIFDQLAATYSFEQLAVAIPAEQRQQILDVVFSQRQDAGAALGTVQLDRQLALDRLLSVDGRGDGRHQEECIKAIELAGAVSHAEDLWIEHIRNFPHAVNAYCRLASIERCRQNYGYSLKYVEAGIAAGLEPGHPLPPFSLQLERIRTHAAEKNYEYSLGLIDQFIPELRDGYAVGRNQRHEKVAFLIHLSHASLIRGFILDEMGRSEEATKAWRDGYLETRAAIGQVNAAGTWLVPNVLILGSLSGELKREDIPGLVVMLSGVAVPQQLARVAIAQIGEETVHNTLLKMWRRPDTRTIARDGYAWHQMSYQDRYQMMTTLAGQEFFLQNSIGDDFNESQRQIAKQAVDALIQQIGQKKLTVLDLMTLSFAWKRPGEKGAGFEPIFDRLPTRPGALASYFIARRLSVQGADQPAVEHWLGRAYAGLKQEADLAAQIQAELDQLRSQQGQLTLVNPLGRTVSVQLQGPDGLEKTAELSDNIEWKLPAGEYQLKLLAGAGASFANEVLFVRPLEPQEAVVQSKWTPGSDAESWPGIVQQPAKLPGIKKWQMVSRQPKTDLSVIQASPAGTEIALGGRDGTVRIYDDAQQGFTHWLPGHALSVSAISWSDDGRQLLSASLDGSYQLWSLADSRLISTGRQEQGLLSAALSGDGSLLAISGYDKQIHVRRRDGTLLRTFAEPACQAVSLCWTSDGQRLLSSDAAGQFCVWSLDADEPLLRKSFGAAVRLKMTDDRTQVALWKPSGGATQVLETETWRELGTVAADVGAIRAVEWDDAATNLTVLATSGELQVLDANFAAQEEASIGKVLNKAKSSETTGLTRLADNRWACIGYGGAARARDADLQPAEDFITSGASGVNLLHWRPGRDEVLVGSADGRMRLLDRDGGEQSQLDVGSKCFSAAWSGDGERLAICRGSGEIVVYEDDLTKSQTLDVPRGQAYLVWTPQHNLLILPVSGAVELFDFQTGESQSIAKVAGGVGRPPAMLQDAILFSTARYELVKLGIEKPFPTHVSDYGGAARAISGDPTSDWTAVTWGSTIRIFAAEDFEQPAPQPRHVWNDGTGQVRSLAWSADGTSLYALEDRGHLQQWDRTGNLTAKLSTANQLIPDLLAISPQEKVAVTGTDAPLVTFLDLEEKRTRFSLLLSEKAADQKIYAGGYCAGDPQSLDESHVCVLLREDGTLATKAPSEFLNRP